jgi:hypothetical protein
MLLAVQYLPISTLFVPSCHGCRTAMSYAVTSLSPVLWQFEVSEELRTARAQAAQFQEQRDDALRRLVLSSNTYISFHKLHWSTGCP